MARTRTCDMCGKQIEKVTIKLWITPAERDNKKAHWNPAKEYTAHADIGPCCAGNVVKIIKWQKRQRRNANGAAASVAQSNAAS